MKIFPDHCSRTIPGLGWSGGLPNDHSWSQGRVHIWGPKFIVRYLQPLRKEKFYQLPFWILHSIWANTLKIVICHVQAVCSSVELSTSITCVLHTLTYQWWEVWVPDYFDLVLIMVWDWRVGTGARHTGVKSLQGPGTIWLTLYFLLGVEDAGGRLKSLVDIRAGVPLFI